ECNRRILIITPLPLHLVLLPYHTYRLLYTNPHFSPGESPHLPVTYTRWIPEYRAASQEPFNGLNEYPFNAT
ncbi:hypothetical protein ASPSYDRAFT_52818, partial [Aspergillus sydowii CBS 593.65]